MSGASIVQMANRIGTIPFIGTVVATARFAIAITISAIALLILVGKFLITKSGHELLENVVRVSIGQTAFATIEAIPFAGTWLHSCYMESADPDDLLSLGFENDYETSQDCYFPSPTLFKVIFIANKIGAFPFIGSLVGIVRFIVSFTVAITATTILSCQYACNGRGSELLERVTVLGWGHSLIGILEITPGIGTLTHYVGKSQSETSLLCMSMGFGNDVDCSSIPWKNY